MVGHNRVGACRVAPELIRLQPRSRGLPAGFVDQSRSLRTEPVLNGFQFCIHRPTPG